VIEGQELYVTPSIGISLFPSDDSDVERLIRNADTAMYHAKDNGRNNFQFYTHAMHGAAVHKLALGNELRHALDREEFELHYQPITNIATGRIEAVEALVRWKSPERGLVGPDDFIPFAEESGLIVAIGHWVLGAACEQAKRWKDAGLTGIRVTVNISPRQFDQQDFADEVADALARRNLAPSALGLEVTEGTVMKDIARSGAILQRLKSMGVGIYVDDFGTGYSSLGYLKQFPIDALKIDRSFIADITREPFDEAIAKTVVTLAHSLSLGVVAEGVETAEQLSALRRLGCDHAQGYLFSRPVCADECTLLLMGGADSSVA
jgi:EAL domain-containing protein (putative c-di-GMP-specific phosphodiesterase class I)